MLAPLPEGTAPLIGETSELNYRLGVQLILQLCHEIYLSQCGTLCRQHKHQGVLQAGGDPLICL